MKTIKYKIRIKGLRTPSGTISILALKDLASIFIENSERALRLAIEGNSLKKGQPPLWLKEAVDFNITSIGKGSTTLSLEAPELCEVASEQINQQHLWINLPEPNDTALTIWANSFNEATTEKYESEMYDKGLLTSFISFKDFIDKYAQSIEIDSMYDKKVQKLNIDQQQLERVQKLTASIPEPRKIILSGLIDVIEHFAGRFKLYLENGEKIQGEIDRSILDLEVMRSYWGKKVTVRGMADYKPNGKVRFIKVDLLKPFEESEKLFEEYMIFEEPRELVYQISKYKSESSSLKEIWGKWPSEESIEQILTELD
jgi:hypothetical protein